MKLYRLKRKSDGKFFVQAFSPDSPKWSSSGAFFKKIDTVVKHLNALTWEWEIKKSDYNSYKFYYRRIEGSHRPEIANEYQICVTDVTVNNETLLEGSQFIK